MSALTTPPAERAITLRPIEAADGPAVARIVFDAFAGIHDHHRFERDFPTLDAASGLVDAFTAHPSIWGVVAEADGRIVGSNFLDERGAIAGVGPITVDPAAQADGVGRRLMEAVLERGRDARGVRLLQDAFNRASLALYTSLGFAVREPVVLLGGRPRTVSSPDAEVRPLEPGDLAGAERLALAVHGFHRTAELSDALAAPHLTPTVVVRDGRVTAYATTLAHFPLAHATGESGGDLRALIAGTLASSDAPASFLLPARQHDLLRWCLEEGLRIVKPMTYMTTGEFREPQGAWVPTVLY